jgi:hypothetical protein
MRARVFAALGTVSMIAASAAIMLGSCALAPRLFPAKPARLTSPSPATPLLRPTPPLQEAPSMREATGIVVRVPHASGSIVLDGDTDDRGWTLSPGPARSGPFVQANGAVARPYTDARLLWGDDHLYVALYAADEDLQARVDEADRPLGRDDSFRLTFTRGDGTYLLEVSPKGVLADAVRRGAGDWDYRWNSGAHVAHEFDGTLNDDRDADEEWVIEMAIPFESLGLRGERGERVGFSAGRCDSPKKGPEVCASWAGGDLVLD